MQYMTAFQAQTSAQRKIGLVPVYATANARRFGRILWGNAHSFKN